MVFNDRIAANGLSISALNRFHNLPDAGRLASKVAIWAGVRDNSVASNREHKKETPRAIPTYSANKNMGYPDKFL